MNASDPSILLIDDNQTVLDGLASRLKRRLPKNVALGTWLPRQKDHPLEDAFNCRVDDNTVLVIADYDLTVSVTGLFGPSIVGWCQKRSIPVGEFSRANAFALPKEPNLFELRVPSDEEKAAEFIADTFDGFRNIRERLESRPQLLKEQRGLAAVLSSLLDRPGLESQFASYMSRLGAANSALLETLKASWAKAERPDDLEMTRLLSYVLGHVLSNAVLKYPGPILSGDVLCAYLATAPEEIERLGGLFEEAEYRGPFSNGGHLFWRDDVDKILDEKAESIADEQFDSFGDYNRGVVEAALKRELKTHSCQRCHGRKGGFWCPFTMRPVCERGDCSVPASSWIPTGAQLSRVEKDFYDEWAPILGF